MTRNPALTHLQDLEAPVCDVRRWGVVLTHLAASDHLIDGETIHVIANTLIALGHDLEGKWRTAFTSARGDA